jgi:hypothetical protein
VPRGAVPAMRDEKPRSKPRPVIQYPTAQLDEERPPRFLEICWPLAGGLILAFVAPFLYDELLWAPHWMMWLVFPFVVLTGRRDLGLNEYLPNLLPTAILYAQFPIEGLLAYWSLSRRNSVAVALAPAIFIHASGWFVLTLLNIYLK